MAWRERSVDRLIDQLFNCLIQVRESRHKIDELEKAALLDPGRVQAQEAELRDLRCKVEFLTRKRRMSCGHYFSA